MVVIEPIGDSQRCQVEAMTEHYIREAEDIFGRSFRRIPVAFDLKGRSAGMFRTQGRHSLIRYNPWIFAKYFEENLHDTVAHEVAHYIVHEVFGRRARPHGEEWRAVMTKFGAKPEATFQLDLSGVPQRRQATHRYECACRIHDVSSTRHNRVQRGVGRYHCVNCDAQLVYTP